MAQPRGVEYDIPNHRRPSRLSYRIWNSARQRAAKSNIPFTITKAWFDTKLEAGVCEVTKLPFVLASGGRGSPNPWVPSLDQTAPGGGYTPENTRVVCWMYNCAKHTALDCDVMRMAVALVKNHG